MPTISFVISMLDHEKKGEIPRLLLRKPNKKENMYTYIYKYLPLFEQKKNSNKKNYNVIAGPFVNLLISHINKPSST